MPKTIALQKLTALVATVIMALALLLPSVVYGQGNRPDVEEKVNERKEAAQLRVEEKRLEREVKSEQRRQEACERRQARVNAAMSRLETQASRHFDVIGSFYSRVQGFYDSGQLTVSNYDELNAAVEAAQEAAEVEVLALAEQESAVDCADPDVAIDIGAFRNSTAAAREALKAYRSALVDLISAMRAAAAEENSNNEDGTESEELDGQNESEDEGETESETETETETETEDETGDESDETTN